MKSRQQRVSYRREILFLITSFLKSPIFFILLIVLGLFVQFNDESTSISIGIAIAAIMGTHFLWGLYIVGGERSAIPDEYEPRLLRKSDDSRLQLFLSNAIHQYQLGAVLMVAFVFMLGVTKGLSILTMSGVSAALIIPAFLPFLYSLTSFSIARTTRLFTAHGIGTHRFTVIEALPFVTFLLVDDSFVLEEEGEASASVESLALLGVRTRLITALPAERALVAARYGGIARPYDVALTGKDINTLNDAELYAMLQTVRVFANLLPHHEERIVQVLKRYGEVVIAEGRGDEDDGLLKYAHVSMQASLHTSGNSSIVMPTFGLEHVLTLVIEGKRMLMRIERLLMSALLAFIMPVIMIMLGFLLLGKLAIPLVFLFGGTIIGLPLIPLLVLFDEVLFGKRRTIRLWSFWRKAVM